LLQIERGAVVNRIMGIIGIGMVAIGLGAVVIFGIKNLDKNKISAPESNDIENLIGAQKLDEAKKLIDSLAEKKPGAKLGKFYIELGKACEDKKELIKARDAYQIILKKYQNVDIADVQDRLGKLNIAILFSSSVTDKDIVYEVEPGDALINIAKKFKTTVELIKKANGLKSDTIRVSSKLKISKAAYKILVDKSQNLLTLLADDDVLKVYRVSTGENNCTPAGTFKIVNKIVDPVWYTQKAVVPAESPDNILGSRWLGLSAPGYGIHGTTQSESIGRQATKGCVRMTNSDVEELYTVVPAGTEVTIVD
jgi:lipoprotein-anchoring transpeptidase ErfK/SrfK